MDSNEILFDESDDSYDLYDENEDKQYEKYVETYAEIMDKLYEICASVNCSLCSRSRFNSIKFPTLKDLLHKDESYENLLRDGHIVTECLCLRIIVGSEFQLYRIGLSSNKTLFIGKYHHGCQKNNNGEVVTFVLEILQIIPIQFISFSVVPERKYLIICKLDDKYLNKTFCFRLVDTKHLNEKFMQFISVAYAMNCMKELKFPKINNFLKYYGNELLSPYNPERDHENYQTFYVNDIDQISKIWKPDSSLFDISVEEFNSVTMAETLTMLQVSHLLSIDATEFYSYNWLKENRWNQSPNLIRYLLFNERIILLVMTTIVECSDLERRATILNYWIKVAYQLRRLRNYEGLRVLLAGLDVSAVFRLNDTWEKAFDLKPKLILFLTYVWRLMSNDDNWLLYIEHYYRSMINPPCLPNISYLLQKMTIPNEEKGTNSSDGFIHKLKKNMTDSDNDDRLNSDKINELTLFRKNKQYLYSNYMNWCTPFHSTEAIEKEDHFEEFKEFYSDKVNVYNIADVELYFSPEQMFRNVRMKSPNNNVGQLWYSMLPYQIRRIPRNFDELYKVFGCYDIDRDVKYKKEMLFNNFILLPKNKLGMDSLKLNYRIFIRKPFKNRPFNFYIDSESYYSHYFSRIELESIIDINLIEDKEKLKVLLEQSDYIDENKLNYPKKPLKVYKKFVNETMFGFLFPSNVNDIERKYDCRSMIRNVVHQTHYKKVEELEKLKNTNWLTRLFSKDFRKYVSNTTYSDEESGIVNFCCSTKKQIEDNKIELGMPQFIYDDADEYTYEMINFDGKHNSNNNNNNSISDGDGDTEVVDSIKSLKISKITLTNDNEINDVQLSNCEGEEDINKFWFNPKSENQTIELNQSSFRDTENKKGNYYITKSKSIKSNHLCHSEDSHSISTVKKCFSSSFISDRTDRGHLQLSINKSTPNIKFKILPITLNYDVTPNITKTRSSLINKRKSIHNFYQNLKKMVPYQSTSAMKTDRIKERPKRNRNPQFKKNTSFPTIFDSNSEFKAPSSIKKKSSTTSTSDLFKQSYFIIYEKVENISQLLSQILSITDGTVSNILIKRLMSNLDILNAYTYRCICGKSKLLLKEAFQLWKKLFIDKVEIEVPALEGTEKLSDIIIRQLKFKLSKFRNYLNIVEKEHTIVKHDNKKFQEQCPRIKQGIQEFLLYQLASSQYKFSIDNDCKSFLLNYKTISMNDALNLSIKIQPTFFKDNGVY
ncbi:hypothetical protein SNEBB_001897 [Seison nebaliae]|nr:hypothetical protein SNEBB_001897 [Seison nebaliae]